jgi:hypothetical protein
MEVRRITAQPEPLEGHYARLANDPRTSPDYAEMGRRMLELLRLLPAIDGPPVWAVTSHADLHLVASDDYRQRSLVAVRGGGVGEAFSFGVEYPVPDGEAPWPGAQMLLGTHDTVVACEMVAYGLGKATGVAYSYRRHAEPSAAPDRRLVD